MTRVLAQVKFFSRRGYGFVTILEGDLKGNDVFLHHTAIQPLYTGFRTLRRGEIVECDVIDSETVEGKKQAVHITGVRGAPMMCDIAYLMQNEYSRIEAIDENALRA